MSGPLVKQLFLFPPRPTFPEMTKANCFQQDLTLHVYVRVQSNKGNKDNKMAIPQFHQD